MQKKIHFNEDFLHYIWKNKLFTDKYLIDNEGNKIEVIETGTHNFDAGPDFFNAKIKIGETIWAGNVEIHTKSSFWEAHKHQQDKAYDNVILHLVNKNDTEVHNTKGEKILTCELKFDNKYINNYDKLLRSENNIACNKFINKIDSFTLNSWLTNILIERIEQKTEYIKNILSFTNNNWEETFYISLAKAFGFKVNADPFELLAKSLPSIILAKNKNNLFQIEALLFGQAGMLSAPEIKDNYFISLKKEYKHLKNKYNLKPVEPHLWKFLRIRPDNFPTIRISQFAALIHKSSHLFSKVLESNNINSVMQLFDVEASGYWSTHYTFGKESKKRIKTFGKIATENILINTVIPIMFLYGKEKANEKVKDRAINFLEKIKPEKNNITKKWASIGLDIKNAYFSQSYIQLYNEYCSKRKCLNCRIGNKFINV
ncbi:MAG: DUF2851 family protein [Bacteroidales bacterium]|nr:DUF2851 family protein [Bacteroidales bacterium]